MDISDALLVEQCKEGRREAFAELVRRHQDSVYNLACRMSRSHADAADLAQESFVRAYTRLRQYRADYSFRNWLLAICANMARNQFRKTDRRNRLEEKHAQFEEVQRETRDDTPDFGRLEAALGRIEPTLRAPLVLKHVEGLSYGEIAKVLKIDLFCGRRYRRRCGRLLLASNLH